jgi:hypothetical protein
MGEDHQQQHFSFIFRPRFEAEARRNLTKDQTHPGIQNHADSLQDRLCESI